MAELDLQKTLFLGLSVDFCYNKTKGKNIVILLLKIAEAAHIYTIYIWLEKFT